MLRRLIEITLPLRPHPPGAWRLTSSLPQSPYCKYDSVGPSGRTRHPPRWAVPSLGKIIYVILLTVMMVQILGCGNAGNTPADFTEEFAVDSNSFDLTLPTLDLVFADLPHPHLDLVNIDFPPPPEEPLIERGLILPPNSLPCINPETGTETMGCNHHGSSVAVTSKGTVLAVWYHGLHEKSKDSRIVWSQRSAAGEFGPVEVLFDDPGRAEGNPAIWVHEDGTLYLFFVTIMGESWNDCEVRLIRSSDNGMTWSDIQVLRQDWKWMVRNHPIRMSNGEILLPLYDETTFTPSFMISPDDFTDEWTEVSFADDPQGFFDHLNMIQPRVIERGDKTLLALHRNAGTKHKMGQVMTSSDFGQSWTPGLASTIPNDSTGIEMTRLHSGRIALAFNNTITGRYPLSVALSDDEGQTWSAVVDLDEPCAPGQSCSHGYTSIAQDLTDQSIWITYTHNRSTIGWVHLNETWILAQDSVPLATL